MMKVKNVLVYLALVLVSAYVLFPIYWLATMSFKRFTDILSIPPKFIFEPSFEAYINTFITGRFATYFINSLVIAISSTVLSVAIAAPAAYSFARWNFKGRSNLFYWIFSNRTIPPIIAVIFFYMLATSLRLVDTHIMLIICYMIFNLPLAVVLLESYIEEVPKDLEDAAFVDGCSLMGAFFRIVLPAMMPGLIVTLLFCFIFAWNEFMIALTLTHLRAKTFPVGISEFWTTFYIGWNEMAAVSLVSIIPPLLFALVMRKHIVRGLTLGAVKG